MVYDRQKFMPFALHIEDVEDVNAHEGIEVEKRR